MKLKALLQKLASKRINLNLWPQESNSLFYQLSSNYLSTQVVLALEELGVFKALKKKGKTIKILSRELKIKHPGHLNMLLDFLWSTTSLVHRDKHLIYSLTDKNFPHSMYILNAYKSVFDNLATLSTGKKRYDQDVFRNGLYLKEASDNVTLESITSIINSLKTKRDLQLIDLGCGSAASLVAFCKQNRWGFATGVDIDLDTVQAAQKRLCQEGISNRASVVHADIRKVSQWRSAKRLSKHQVFIASTVFHEFLLKGENYLIKILKRIKHLFPGSTFYLLEFDTPSFEEIKQEKSSERKLFFAMYKLWHPFSNQGMPQPQAVWERIITKSGWQIKQIVREKYDLLIYSCSL